MKISAVLIAVAVLSLSCTLDTRYFKDYEGKNLIAAFDFGAVDAATSKPAWVSMTAPASGPDPYLNYQAAASVPGPTGITSPVYRLELLNLMPNGDFETNYDPTLWQTQNLALAPQPATLTLQQFDADQAAAAGTKVINNPPNYSVGTTNPSPIKSRSLFFDGRSSYDQLFFDFQKALGTNYLVGQYDIHFDFKTPVSIYAQFTEFDGATYSNVQSWSLGAGPKNSAVDDNFVSTSVMPNNDLLYSPFEFTNLTHSHRFSIGILKAANGTLNGAPQTLVLDNFKIVRTDVPHSLELKLFSLAAASPPLLPGKYHFYFSVLDDPSVGTATGLNRFQAQYLTVEILAATKLSQNGSAIVYKGVIPRGYTTDFGATSLSAVLHTKTWAAWTEIDLAVPNVIDFVDLDPAPATPPVPVLTVRISPNLDYLTDAERWSPGSVLICNPRLVFFEK